MSGSILWNCNAQRVEQLGRISPILTRLLKVASINYSLLMVQTVVTRSLPASLLQLLVHLIIPLPVRLLR